MADILFLPMNTNHVIIFESVIKELSIKYNFLCHDRLCDGSQYFTEKTLEQREMPFLHFDGRCTLPYNADLISRIKLCLKIKKIIKRTLKKIKPKVIVLGVDNDHVALMVIDYAKKNGIKTILLQDGLIRPQEYSNKVFNLYPDAIYAFLKKIGIPIKSTVYGLGRCNITLVNGNIANNILEKRGAKKGGLVIVGQPKYDFFLENLKKEPIEECKEKSLLFAATKELIKDNENIAFLKKLATQCLKERIYLIVKMHPRSKETPEDVLTTLSGIDMAMTKVIKEGDDTIEILKKCSGVITLYSTVIIEALMMDKEGIAVHYLAGTQNLCHYDKFDAIHSINDISDVVDIIKMVMKQKKSYKNKKELLESEIYKLDGKASKRVANVVETAIV